MQYPKISIVTPSYNQAEYLEETICSVLDQGYPNLEYIIIDGGSVDGSVDIIKKYEKNFKYWVSERDNGHGEALNKGFSKTTGEIMAWLNSDDKYVAGALFSVAEIFVQFNDVSWITGKHGWWSKEGKFIDEKHVYKNIYDYLIGDYKWIQQESTFWRRKLWELAGGHINENYKLMVDGELWTKFFYYDDLWHVNKVLSGYRVHDTNRAKLYSQEITQEMEQAIELLRNKVFTNNSIRNNLLLLNGDLGVYTKELDLSYPVIDHVDGCWLKKNINYFAVKMHEQSSELLSIKQEELIDLTLLKLLNKKIIIWGTGGKAQQYYELFCSNGISDKVVGFADNNPDKCLEPFNNKIVFSPNNIRNFEGIIIIASMHYFAIGKQLEEIGFLKYKDWLYYPKD